MQVLGWVRFPLAFIASAINCRKALRGITCDVHEFSIPREAGNFEFDVWRTSKSYCSNILIISTSFAFRQLIFEHSQNPLSPLPFPTSLPADHCPSFPQNRASNDCQTHYLSTGKEGWLIVAPKDQPDQPEGCVVPFVYPNGTGWVGFFCINSPFRGRGWGATLFQAGLNHFAANGAEVVGLDAVQEQVKTYERRGFVDKARIRLMVREGLGTQPLEGGLGHPQEGERLFPLERVPSEVLTRSDLEHLGLERPKVWTKEAMFSRPDAFGFALVKGETMDELQGWILVRSCQHGFRFGPLYAKTKEKADLLLRTAMKRVEKEQGTFIAEVWPQNPEANEIFEEAGWKYAGIDYHRMWLNGVVPMEQRPGGLAEKECFAIFDAGEG